MYKKGQAGIHQQAGAGQIVVVGAKGFVGSAVREALVGMGEKVLPASRGDDLAELISENVAAVVHCANSPKRYLAMQEPRQDYVESVEKTADILEMCRRVGCRVTVVSSISARTEVDTVYGHHRRLVDSMLRDGKETCIRLGYMYSQTHTNGALNDILNDRDVYRSPQSRYSFCSVSYCAAKIAQHVRSGSTESQELGARGSMSLEQVAQILGKTPTYKSDYVDVQIAENVPPDAPDMRVFSNYLRTLRLK